MSPWRLEHVTLHSKQDLVLHLQAGLRDFVFPAFQRPSTGSFSLDLKWPDHTCALIHPNNTGPAARLTARFYRAWERSSLSLSSFILLSFF